ncbi:zinc-binding dehydrogenase [Mycobacterium sp. 852013-50091_SCH5140682]|uniref:zinc-dependent alcohol dehydrogenase n=1 Tax=Mycobacterium sp. 852013-50091_SCH5140682 TaxID=1834109 RepID=UPI000B25BCA0|nr:zinc-binding dehydrogenase [Mycobacterium sp. 852013-50091_SCH5140682]
MTTAQQDRPGTVTAIQFTQNRDIEIVDRSYPTISADEVVIRSRIVGLCRSDIELLHGHLDDQLGITGPVTPGHEWSGEIVEVGANVTHLAPGDPVVGECVLAPNTWFGFDYPGAGAQYFRAPARLIHKLPESINFHQGALIEPFTIAYKGIKTAGGCDASDVVVVIGAGMVGLSATAIAAANRATTVIVEPNPHRRELALALGATHTIDPVALSREPQHDIERLTGSAGGSLVIEASGSSPGLASTFSLAQFGGRVLNIGICTDPHVCAPIGLIQAKDLTIYGTTGSSEIWPQALTFLQRHGIQLDTVISKVYPINEAHDAIAAADDPGNVKIHVDMQPAGSQTSVTPPENSGP